MNEMPKTGSVKDLIRLLLFEKNNDIRNGLYDTVQTAMSYHSNKIEGSTLTYEGTWELYDKGVIISDEVIKSSDISDAQGHFLMFDKMLDTLEEPIGKNLVCSYHEALKSTSYYDRKKKFAIGSYKKLNNSIGGLIQTVDVSDVENEMEDLFDRYNTIAEIGHTYKTLAANHISFERIHPFQDGNGRVGRMLLFRQCIDAGLMPCLITENFSIPYKNALKEASSGISGSETLSAILEKSSISFWGIAEHFVSAFMKGEH